MRRPTMNRISLALAGLLLLCAAPGALGQEDEALVGELRLDMNSDYAKIRVNGEDWTERVEFEKNGKRAIVKFIDLSRETNEITATPVFDGLDAVTVVVKSKAFKRKKIRKREYRMVLSKTIRFPKSKTQPKPDKEPEPEPEPESPKVVPGEEPDDL